MGKQWTNEEKQLVRESNSEDDLAVKYINKFGTADKSRVHSLFSHRNRLILESQIPKVKTEPIKVHTQLAFADSEILVNISNKLSELIQIQKEMLELFKNHLQKKE